MDKKNFIIEYTLFDKNWKQIKTGTVRSRYKANETEAIIGASGYLKAVYTTATAIGIHSCKEEKPEPQTGERTIDITITIRTVA